MKGTRKGGGEFDLIAKIFAPLARGEPGALGLRDDAAILKPAPGCRLVMTTDAIVAGVHFFPSDPPATIGQKALHVNVSDLAAKGATPWAYLLTVMLPAGTELAWLRQFAVGLRRSQSKYGIGLVGGDTVATPGPLAFNVVAFGQIAAAKMITRSGARIGEDVWITGTIGDAYLGLKALRGECAGLKPRFLNFLIDRYRVPQPRLSVGRSFAAIASAALDVSDGLLADLGHIARNSGVAICVEAARVPLSNGAKAALAENFVTIEDLLTGGDDYEIAFTAPSSAKRAVAALAAQTGLPITKIGKVMKGDGVTVVDARGKRFRSKGQVMSISEASVFAPLTKS